MKVAHDDTLEFNLVVGGYEHSSNDRSTEKIFPRGRYELLEPFRQHSSWTEQQAVAFHNVHFFAANIAELADSISVKRLTWPLHSQAAPAPLRRLLEELGRESKEGRGVPGHELVMEALATQLAVTLVRAHHGTPTREGSILQTGATRERLDRAAERMSEEPEATFSLELLASEAGMSRFHFLREFKKAFGLTPHAFLLERRLERAANLLRKGERTITTIALDSGFGSSSQFSTHFKRRFGVAPSRWGRGER
jgi:AraC family transcriptional regulator